MRTKVGSAFLLLALTLSQPALAQGSCFDPLENQEHRLIAQPLVQEVLEKAGLDCASRSCSSFINWLGIDPAQFPEIVVFSFTNFLGDNLIFHFSMIEYLSAKYPGVPIKVISPKAGVIADSDRPGLSSTTFPVRFALFKERKDRDEAILTFTGKLPGFVKENIKPGSLVIFDLTTLIKAENELSQSQGLTGQLPINTFFRSMHSVRATAIGLSTLLNDRVKPGFTDLAVAGPPAQLPSELQNSPQATQYRLSGNELMGVLLNAGRGFPEQTMYEGYENAFKFLFGADARLSWNPRDYMNTAETEPMQQQFLLSSFDQPGREYGVLNLNTFGGDKVKELTPVYADILESVVTSTMEKNPGLNLFVTFPEAPFGPEVQVRVMDFISKYKGKIAFLPASTREIQGAVVAKSKFVVSYDSGLVHLCAFLPKERVLTVSLGQGLSEMWRKAGQPYVKVQNAANWRALAKGINEWIDAKMHPRPPTTPHWFQRVSGAVSRWWSG